MITALDQPSDIDRAVEAGTDDFLTKPINKTELLLRVRSAAREPAATSASSTGPWPTSRPSSAASRPDDHCPRRPAAAPGPAVLRPASVGLRRRHRRRRGRRRPTATWSTCLARRQLRRPRPLQRQDDIALLVIDATEGVTGQDQRLAERIDAAGCPILILLNKWELITDPDDRLSVLAELSRKLAFIGDAPVLKVSALTGKGVHKLRPVLQEAIAQYHRRVPTRDVNRVIVEAQQRHPAAGGAKVLYAVQGASDPPTFTLFANRELPHTYVRYLERSIREAFGFGSTPLKLRVRKRSG